MYDPDFAAYARQTLNAVSFHNKTLKELDEAKALAENYFTDRQQTWEVKIAELHTKTMAEFTVDRDSSVALMKTMMDCVLRVDWEMCRQSQSRLRDLNLSQVNRLDRLWSEMKAAAEPMAPDTAKPGDSPQHAAGNDSADGVTLLAQLTNTRNLQASPFHDTEASKGATDAPQTSQSVPLTTIDNNAATESGSTKP